MRKILAGVPASVVIRDHILALSFSRSKRQYWTVGNRPIRKNDLRSLHRNSVEAQIQDRSRQKTGLNTAPGFSRVYPSFPRTTPSFPRAIRHSRGRGNPEKTKHTAKPPLRAAKGTRAQHAGDARKPPTPPLRSSEHQDKPIIPPSSPHPLRHSREPSVIPADYPVIPASHPSFPRTREPSKNKAHRQTSPSRSEGDACAARRGCPKTTNTPPSKLRTPRQPLHHPPTPSVIPASPSFPQAFRHSRKPYVIPASLTSFPRTREPREKQSTPFPPKPTPPPSTQQPSPTPPSPPPPTTKPPPSPPPIIPASPSVIPASPSVIPADAGTQRKTKHANPPFPPHSPHS